MAISLFAQFVPGQGPQPSKSFDTSRDGVSIVRHIGSASTDDELTVLWQKAEIIREQLCAQPSFLAAAQQKPILHVDHLALDSVTHKFALTFLRDCFCICGLGFLNPLYQDLNLMRIIEPASKLRTLELLERYFGLSYARGTLCRLFPKLIDHKNDIEEAAYHTRPCSLRPTLCSRIV